VIDCGCNQIFQIRQLEMYLSLKKKNPSCSTFLLVVANETKRRKQPVLQKDINRISSFLVLYNNVRTECLFQYTYGQRWDLSSRSQSQMMELEKKGIKLRYKIDDVYWNDRYRTFSGNFAAESAGRLGRDGTEDELVGVRLIQLSDERIENDLMLYCYVKGLADWISIDSVQFLLQLLLYFLWWIII